MVEEDFDGVVAKILDDPKHTANWTSRIAMLIGEARAHRNLKALLKVEGTIDLENEDV